MKHERNGWVTRVKHKIKINCLRRFPAGRKPAFTIPHKDLQPLVVLTSQLVLVSDELNKLFIRHVWRRIVVLQHRGTVAAVPKAPKNDEYIVRPRAEHALSPTNSTVAVWRLLDGAPVLRETAVEAVSVWRPSEQTLERYPVSVGNDV
jgi:hypothetical protein